MMKIKDYVYNYRKEHGLSMQAFGDMCGLSRAYISILEKGVNPTTGKPFAPGIDTLKRIADCTGSDLDVLIKMLDGDESIIVNKRESITVTAQEEVLIKKYRQLDASGKERINEQIDFELYKIERNAMEKEELLG